MTRLHEALTYRAHRLSPIPFYARSKTPAFDEGEIVAYRRTPATSAQLRTLFADPTLNIGVLTGNGHIVVDVDGDEGQQSLKGLALPDTPTVITSDESHYHLHFRTHADDVLHTRIRPLPGIDILANDWQVLMPSSTHPNHHTYTWAPGHRLTDLELSTPPAWVLDLSRSPDAAPPPVLSDEREQVSKRKSLLADGRA